MAFKYVGQGEYMIGVPARDLNEADLAEILEREGITRQDIEAAAIYEAVERTEVAPFCGVDLELGGGRRCRRRVSDWGERCDQHQGMIVAHEIRID
jgi:hypothetical protein